LHLTPFAHACTMSCLQNCACACALAPRACISRLLQPAPLPVHCPLPTAPSPSPSRFAPVVCCCLELRAIRLQFHVQSMCL
jgi:hypothetical protein